MAAPFDDAGPDKLFFGIDELVFRLPSEVIPSWREMTRQNSRVVAQGVQIDTFDRRPAAAIGAVKHGNDLLAEARRRETSALAEVVKALLLDVGQNLVM